MNSKFRNSFGIAALAVVSVFGLRDTGVFVADHETTLYSGNKLSFTVEEEANIIEYKENGYLVQKGKAKVTVPRNKILITEGPVQKFTVKKNTSIRKNGQVLRNLFLGEVVHTIQIKDKFVEVQTNDGLVGEVALEFLEAVEGPYVTEAKAKEDVVLENENGKYNLTKDKEVKVVSFADGLFIIVDDQGKPFAVAPKFLDFGNNGIKVEDTSVQQAEAPVEAAAEKIAVVEDAPSVDNALAQKVLDSAYSKIGSPYIWGSTGQSGGYDCSGLVYAIYVNELGVSLPRTSSSQSQVGDQISREQLQPGDLIFFNTSGKGVSHVGIYVGDDVFIHASSGSKQVKTNKLSEKYYNERYVNATRVL